MIKLGSIILSLWALLNILASLVVVLIPIIFHGGSTPALLESLSEAEVNSINPTLFANANSIAVFANGLNIAFCALSLFLIWNGLFHKKKWTFWALSISYTLVLGAGVAADYVAGFLHPGVNLISGVILFVGLGFSAISIFSPER